MSSLSDDSVPAEDFVRSDVCGAALHPLSSTGPTLFRFWFSGDSLSQPCHALWAEGAAATHPSQAATAAAPLTDEDGDLVLARPSAPSPARSRACAYLDIQHSLATSVTDVGQQVWRAALLLADWSLHSGRGGGGGALAHARTVLELGAGVGMTAAAVAAAMAAGTPVSGGQGPAAVTAALHIPTERRLFVTDFSSAALTLARTNLRSNATRMASGGGNSPGGGTSPAVSLRLLDFLDFCSCNSGSSEGAAASVRALLEPLNPLEPAVSETLAVSEPQQAGPLPSDSFEWCAADLCHLEHLDLLLAADVVYDCSLTDGLLRAAAALLRYATDARQRNTLMANHHALSQGRGSPSVLSHSAPLHPPPAGAAAAAAAAAAGHLAQPAVTPPAVASAGAAGVAAAGAEAVAWQRPPPTFVLALERRVCFTLRGLVAHDQAYDHFLSCVRLSLGSSAGSGGGSCNGGVGGEGGCGDGASGSRGGGGGRRKAGDAAVPVLYARQVALSTVPQCFEYERTPELELWELSLEPLRPL